ncbi:beta-lactamase family protein [Paenibacillus spiritus]|uniref:Beta-lactamase family protein n=1 Tax=Paenibacillus spiritus TaxID=2496557 RepID=A0A5J5GCV0_9BACL|nr:serine hydrolase domain-containing protein [Paenibacillus spiritus]KAA9005871.1 beta-lactamase family protein [Paenibacillus spiritus]
MRTSQWYLGALLSSCLLLSACEASSSGAAKPSAVPAMVPTASASDSLGNGAVSRYPATVQAAREKADFLSKGQGTYSVQYALIDHGRIAVSGEAGKNDEQGQKPLTGDTLYGIGSVSKMFTAVAVMQLVERGTVDLDTPVVRYIPDFTMKDERYQKITPRMLLNHSSGLNGSSFTNAFLLGDSDTYAHDTLLKQLAGQTLKADPGAYSVYCNDGFTLAEILVERVSGMDFTAYLHRYMTEPLDMMHTGTPLDSLDETKMAGLYYPAYIGQLPNERVNVIGTGGIYSTAEDLARFSQLFTGNANTGLSAESAAAMAEEEYKTPLWPDEADSSIGYGLGWDSVDLYPFGEYGIKALTKGGDTNLYHASLVVLPEQEMAAAVISAGGVSTHDQLLANEMLLQALKEKGTIAGRKPDKSYGVSVKAEMPTSMMQYAGVYGASGATASLEITADGVMTVHSELPGSMDQRYEYSEDGTFRSTDGNTKIRFVTKGNGHTYVWNRQYTPLLGLGQTAVSEYSGEKLEPQKLPAATAKAWMQRDGKKYYLLTEKYSSLYYMLMQPVQQMDVSKPLAGYVQDKRITGPNTAVSELQIPGTAGRDLSGYTFVKHNGVEYLETNGRVLVSQDAVKPLGMTKRSSVIIPPSGYAQWYTISEEDAGKSLKVGQSSENASFAVYDVKGTCVSFSMLEEQNQAALPWGGSIVFAGDAGTKFELTMP